jgi:N-methylhydantoinase A
MRDAIDDLASISLFRRSMGEAIGYTIGVDIGGTFTDVVVIATDGSVRLAKAPTTPADFSGGVMDAIAIAAADMGLSPELLLARTARLDHGSTVATNALLTRTGARVGLITTRGFEDTPAIMRAVGRVDGLPAEEVRRVTAITKPEPLVPGDLVRGVAERIDAFGRVVKPLDKASVRRAVAELVDELGVEAIAVSLLHAWRNPTHERLVRELIRERHSDDAVFVSLGSDLSQVAGEYARTNTAIANAFIGPVLRGYLGGLERRLADLGFAGQLFVMQGNGGLTGHDRAVPISTLQSGPAGGMLASAMTAERLGHDAVLTADMGGTSFDVGIVDKGYWRYAEEPIFERLRILQPIIEITSIGAGGGTIARVDEQTGRLIVGPQSAGAVPGPVCYGSGGTEPTVTDADVVLGLIDPDHFLGGRRRLDRDAAYVAIERRVAEPLGLGTIEAAAGIRRIVDSKMSDLIRREIIRAGLRPDDLSLYAFGGASPVHAVDFARDLGVREIVIMPSAALFSAYGIASADIVLTRVATRWLPLPVDPAVLNADLEALEADLLSDLDRSLIVGKPTFRRYVTLRFRRQTTGEELALPWDRFTVARVEELVPLFVDHYERLYGSGVAYPEAGLDLAGLRVDLIGRVAKPTLRSEPVVEDRQPAEPIGQRDAWFEGGLVATQIHDMDRLRPGASLAGPAIVESPFTTVVLPPGSTLRVDGERHLVVRP